MPNRDSVTFADAALDPAPRAVLLALLAHDEGVDRGRNRDRRAGAATRTGPLGVPSCVKRRDLQAHATPIPQSARHGGSV